MRKVFLKNLPKWENRSCKGKIDWKNCIGQFVYFEYDDIKGWIQIVKVEGDYLYIKYKNINNFKIYSNSFKQCKLGSLLGKITSNFQLKIGDIIKDEKRDLTIIDIEYRKKQLKEKIEKKIVLKMKDGIDIDVMYVDIKNG